jgi:hypothetical protein
VEDSRTIEGWNLLTKEASKMRKGKEQQKNEAGRQLKLIAWQAGELTGIPDGGTDTAPLNRAELLSVLEKQRTLTEDLLEKIVDYGNLKKAYKQVASNDGSSGIDGMETEELRRWLGKHMESLREWIRLFFIYVFYLSLSL